MKVGKKCTVFEVEAKQRGKPRKTWKKVVDRDNGTC